MTWTRNILRRSFLALSISILLGSSSASAQAGASDRGSPSARLPSPSGNAADVLFWPEQRRDAAFRAMETVTPTRVVAAGDTLRQLPMGLPIQFEDQFNKLIHGDFSKFMARQHMVAVIVLQDGQVRLESYADGMTPKDRWTSFSVAKSITGVLAGAALHDGAIASLDDPVTRYIPGLTGSTYEEVTVRDLLTMTSGVKWSENYADPQSDVARFMTQRSQPDTDAAVAFLGKLPRVAKPGHRWNYSTGDATLLGLLVANATGKSLSEYLSEKIWRPYGMEREAIWAIDRNGHEIGSCCFSATLRDYARFGQFMLDGGMVSGRPVIADNWIRDATTWRVTVDPNGLGYGYQWWSYRYGAYEAKGIFGQSIFVDPVRKLVVVTLSNWPAATGSRELVRAQTQFLIELQYVLNLEKIRAKSLKSAP